MLILCLIGIVRITIIINKTEKKIRRQKRTDVFTWNNIFSNLTIGNNVSDIVFGRIVLTVSVDCQSLKSVEFYLLRAPNYLTSFKFVLCSICLMKTKANSGFLSATGGQGLFKFVLNISNIEQTYSL